MLLSADIGFLGCQDHFCDMLTDAELLDITKCCFQISRGFLSSALQDCMFSSRTGLDPEGSLLFKGKALLDYSSEGRGRRVSGECSL